MRAESRMPACAWEVRVRGGRELPCINGMDVPSLCRKRFLQIVLYPRRIVSPGWAPCPLTHPSVISQLWLRVSQLQVTLGLGQAQRSLT